MDQVKQTTMAGQLYCLSLEPTLTVDDKNKKKPLVLSFQSAFEMRDWQEQVASRLMRLMEPKPTRTSSSSLSINRRRGVILSSIDVENFDCHSPTPPSPATESVVSSSASSVSSAFSLHQSYSALPSLYTTKSNKYGGPDSNDLSTSPTFLQYKNQFHL